MFALQEGNLKSQPSPKGSGLVPGVIGIWLIVVIIVSIVFTVLNCSGIMGEVMDDVMDFAKTLLHGRS